MTSKLLARILALAISLPFVTLAAAQTPAFTKPIKVIYPFSAGGQGDAYARFLAEHASKELGVPVIVDYKAGAAGMLGTDIVAKSPADGQTLLFATGGSITIAPNLYTKLAYDPAKDFIPVARMANFPMAFGVRMDSPYKDVKDLIADAKARPGVVSVGNTGIGSISHLTGELFGVATNTKLLFVPYKGVGDAVQDLIGGRLDVLSVGGGAFDELVRSKKVRVLGNFTEQRVAKSGGAPTMPEATGIKALAFPVWAGLLAPTNTPPALVEKLSAAFIKACKAAGDTEQFNALINCQDNKTFGTILAEDRQRWADVVRKANVKVD